MHIFFPFQCANRGLLVKRWMKHIGYIWKMLMFILDLHLVNILHRNTSVKVYHEVSLKNQNFSQRLSAGHILFNVSLYKTQVSNSAMCLTGLPCFTSITQKDSFRVTVRNRNLCCATKYNIL